MVLFVRTIREGHGIAVEVPMRNIAIVESLRCLFLPHLDTHRHWCSTIVCVISPLFYIAVSIQAEASILGRGHELSNQ